MPVIQITGIDDTQPCERLSNLSHPYYAVGSLLRSAFELGESYKLKLSNVRNWLMCTSVFVAALILRLLYTRIHCTHSTPWLAKTSSSSISHLANVSSRSGLRLSWSFCCASTRRGLAYEQRWWGLEFRLYAVLHPNTCHGAWRWLRNVWVHLMQSFTLHAWDVLTVSSRNIRLLCGNKVWTMFILQRTW